MQRSFTLMILFSVLLAGCTGSPPSLTEASDSPTEHPSTAALDASSTAAGLQSDRSIDYVIRAESIPDEFTSVLITLQVVFVEQPSDLGNCYPEVFSGPYKPTITPLPTPAGQCTHANPVTIDLARTRNGASLGNVTAPESTSGHALIATEIAVKRENGSIVESVKNMGGAELIRSPNPPDGPYGVNVGIQPVAEDREYDYWLMWDRFDPTS